MFDFQRIEFRFPGGGGSGWIAATEAFVDGARLDGWTFRLLELPESYFVACAVEGRWDSSEVDSDTLLTELSLEELVAASASTARDGQCAPLRGRTSSSFSRTSSSE